MLRWAQGFAHVMTLAVCATACAASPQDPEMNEDTDTDADADVDVDVDVDVDDPPSACRAYCEAFLTDCAGTLATPERCTSACLDWSPAALSCRHDWLDAGSCIAAGPQSPTCGS